MAERKPQSRSEQLAPLSREHYEGLLFAWRIREGLKKNVSLLVIKEFMSWFWSNHLQEHFDSEEKFLLIQLPSNDILGLRMQQEHNAMREYIFKIESLALSEINAFVVLLHDHIRFEERELFPHIERIIPKEGLDDIFRQIDKNAHPPSEWKDQFWKG